MRIASTQYIHEYIFIYLKVFNVLLFYGLCMHNWIRIHAKCIGHGGCKCRGFIKFRETSRLWYGESMQQRYLKLF